MTTVIGSWKTAHFEQIISYKNTLCDVIHALSAIFPVKPVIITSF